jgi:hypothetical protein
MHVGLESEHVSDLSELDVVENAMLFLDYP